jgi:hypothetical protein
MISEYTLEDDELEAAILQWLESEKGVDLTINKKSNIRWHYPAEEDVGGTPRPTVVYNDRD